MDRERRIVNRLTAQIALLTAAALLACQASPPPASDSEWAGTVDTLASGRLVVRNPDAPLWRPGEAWELRERYRLGTMDGDGADVFGNIVDVELGPDGALYVLDAQASEVRVFGSDGSHLRTFGRSGRGPGEFNRATGMAFDAHGTLWVMDWGNARYSGFDPSTGALVKEARRLASFAMIPWPGRFDRSNAVLDVGLGPDGDPVILGLDSAFVPRDTLPLPRPDEADQVVFRRGDVPVMSMPVPFAPQPAWAAHPDGGIVVGVGDAYRLHRIGFRGDTVLTIEVDRALVPVTAAERDSAAAALREMAREAGATPDREPRVASVKPAHGALFVDDRSHIWVRRTQAPGEPPAWDVIDDAGRLLGQVAIPVMPTFITPSVRGDLMAVVTRVDDVPAVVVYDIIRGRRSD